MYLYGLPGKAESHGFGYPALLASRLRAVRAIDDDRDECPFDLLPMVKDTATILPDLSGGQRRPDLIVPVRTKGVAEHRMSQED